MYNLVCIVITLWQGWSDEYRTFDDDIELNVDEIRQLLDQVDECDVGLKCQTMY